MQVCDNYEGDTKVFDCFRCHIRFGKKYASKTDKGDNIVKTYIKITIGI